MTSTAGKLSPWAVLAIVLSIGLCPFVTAAAVVVGLLALRDVSRNGRRGRRLAWVAIVLGVVVTPLSGTAMWWWTTHVRGPLMDGPAMLLQMGQSGDVAGFRAGTGGAGTEADAAVFLHALTSHFGPIRSTRPAEIPTVEPTGDAAPPPEPDEPGYERPSDSGWWIWVPYDAMFERGAAKMHARFLLSDPARGWVTSFDRFDVSLPDGGLLRWPPLGDEELAK